MERAFWATDIINLKRNKMKRVNQDTLVRRVYNTKKEKYYAKITCDTEFDPAVIIMYSLKHLFKNEHPSSPLFNDFFAHLNLDEYFIWRGEKFSHENRFSQTHS
jgi:hypothetical protein